MAKTTKNIPAESVIILHLNRQGTLCAKARVAYATPGLPPALVRNALLAVADELLPFPARCRTPGPEVSLTVLDGKPAERTKAAIVDLNAGEQQRAPPRA